MHKIPLSFVVGFLFLFSESCAESITQQKYEEKKINVIPNAPKIEPSQPSSIDVPKLEVEKKSDVVSKEAVKSETQSLKRTITVKNGITKDMTGFPYFSKKYPPDIFTLTVNGSPFAMDEQSTIVIQDNKITISYYLEFNKLVTRKSSKKYVYQLPSDIKAIVISYSWNNTPRIMLDCAGACLSSTEDLTV